MNQLELIDERRESWQTLKGCLYIDSVGEIQQQDFFNRYDKYHIDEINALIDIEELNEQVNRRISEIEMRKMANILREINPLIEVKIR